MHRIVVAVLTLAAVGFLLATAATGTRATSRQVGLSAATMGLSVADDDAPAAAAPAPAPNAAPAPDPEAAPATGQRSSDHPAQRAEEPASLSDGGRARPFAAAGGVVLSAVSDAVVVTGYHEASRSTGAVALRPAAEAPPVPRDGGRLGDTPATVILPSRGRGTAATSAVDLALPAGEAIRSPVDGRVVEVEGYRLYGRSDDVMITIAPDGAADLVVAVLHVDGIRVQAGQRVTAGRTVLAATARRLPFRSQIERYSGALPHVHVDVRPTAAAA